MAALVVVAAVVVEAAEVGNAVGVVVAPVVEANVDGGKDDE